MPDQKHLSALRLANLISLGAPSSCHKGATAELAMDWVLKNGCSEAAEIPYTAQDAACPTPTSSTMLSSGTQARYPMKTRR